MSQEEAEFLCCLFVYFLFMSSLRGGVRIEDLWLFSVAGMCPLLSTHSFVVMRERRIHYFIWWTSFDARPLLASHSYSSSPFFPPQIESRAVNIIIVDLDAVLYSAGNMAAKEGGGSWAGIRVWCSHAWKKLDRKRRRGGVKSLKQVVKSDLANGVAWHAAPWYQPSSVADHPVNYNIVLISIPSSHNILFFTSLSFSYRRRESIKIIFSSIPFNPMKWKDGELGWGGFEGWMSFNKYDFCG